VVRKNYQFSLWSILALTTGFAVVLAACRWAQISVAASLLVAALFLLSLVGAIALVAALVASLRETDDDERGS
jgi:hypothetical protein